MGNFLLIGGAGFIGSAIAKKIIEDNNVVVFELHGSNISRLKPIESNIKIYYGELTQIDLIKEILIDNSIDVVLHLASSLIPSSNNQDYIKDLKTTIIPTIRLLPVFSELNIQFVFFSSGGAVYGNKKNGFFSEQDKLKPISYYGQSKLYLEEAIKFENRKSSLQYLILRPSNPYGIGQNLYGKQGLIATCIYNILEKKEIEIWGDGRVIRDYIYIDDFVKIVLQILKKAKKNQAYNIGSGLGYSVNEVLDVLKKITNNKLKINYLEGRSVDVPSLVLNTNKIKKHINFQTTSLENGIKSFFDFESDNKLK